MKTKLLPAAMLIPILFGACATRPPLATVPHVELRRYTGVWHEVARYPNFFQRDCAGDVTAEYMLQTDGSVQVVNKCRKENGKMAQVVGRATVVPDSGGAKLKVRFFGPFTGDYWVIGLDEKNYSWAVVGHPSRKYLWILARDPKLPPKTYAEILKLIEAKGYDPKKLIVD